MPPLNGQRILVAGGAHRVGKVVAKELAADGADVVISYYSSAEAAAQTAAEIEAMGRTSGAFHANAAMPGEMAALVDWAVETLGGLDVYVHCPSGGFEPTPAADIDEALWDTAMDSTAKGFMFAAQAVHRHMTSRPGGGVLVAITDVAGIQPWPKFAAHCAAKAALIHLMKCLAADWGADGIRVCGVAPGPVLMPEGERGAGEETVLGRMGTPQDVARAVQFCIESDFVTGQNVVVDGGRLLAQ
jgi:NAD(P)-dependent dehydrogenase (short-subunit alcohol dehydrogenase family)